MTVVNTGTEQETIAITAGQVPPPPPLHPVPTRFAATAVTPPLSWISAAVSSVTLAPGKSALVPVTLNIPAGAHPGGYHAQLNAVTAGPDTSGNGTSVTLGVGSAVLVQFAVSAAPPPCNAKPAPVPWWAARPSPRFVPPPGWAFGGPHGQPFVWTYQPSAQATAAGLPPGAAGEPPGWTRTSQMQVWLYGGWDFVLGHQPGWRYLPWAGPLGVVEYTPPGGRLPAWALQLAAGRSYLPLPGIPGTGPAPAAQTPSAGHDSTPGGSAWLIFALIAVVAAGWLLSRRGRRTRRPG